MEIRAEENRERTRIEIKKKTLKNGTIKEYRYERKYNPETDRKVTGKTQLIKRIFSCKDKDKIERIKNLCDELGI